MPTSIFTRPSSTPTPDVSRRRRTEKPLPVEAYAGGRRARGCVHCHQVWEFHRDSMKSAGTWNRDDIWVYPLPENTGVTLNKDRGDRIKALKPSSPAEKAGVKTGDPLRTLNDNSIASF